MNCSDIDLKGYVLEELDAPARATVERHADRCTTCAAELRSLRATHSALSLFPEVEIPRRIAFVSDKVFEPRWWQTIWRSAPAMGFASAALLSGAILVNAFTKPVSFTVPAPPATAIVDTAQLKRDMQEEVATRVSAAVAEQRRQTLALLDASERKNEATERRYQEQRLKDVAAVQQVVRYYDAQMAKWMVASNDLNSRGGQ